MMKQRCSIYRMPSGFHIVSQSVTVHGIGVDVEPFLYVDPSEPDEVLGSRVCVALDASKEEIPPPDADFSKRVLSFLREKSWKRVGKVARLADVLRVGDTVMIYVARSYEDGSFGGDEKPAISMVRPSNEALGAAIRSILG